MKILIINVHSALNLGDDAIMHVTLSALNDAFETPQVVIAANHPQSWHCFPGVEFLGSFTEWNCRLEDGRWRARWLQMPLNLVRLGLAVIGYRLLGRKMTFGAPEQRQLLEAYYDADLVLSCGGGNFYAHRRFSFFLVWALIALGFARALDKPVVMLPQSIGPIEGALQKFFAGQVFRRVRRIMTRERYSADFLTRQLGLPDAPVIQPDLAFDFRPVALPPAIKGDNTVRSPRVGVTIIHRSAQTKSFAGQEEYERALEECLVRLAHERNARITLFVQCYGPSMDHDDRQVTRRLFQRLQSAIPDLTLVDSFHCAADAHAAYAQMDLMIGTRMHTAILSLISGVPVILIGYQPKSCGGMQLIGLPQFCCPIDTVTADRLFALAEKILDDLTEHQQLYAARALEAQRALASWTDILWESL